MKTLNKITASFLLVITIVLTGLGAIPASAASGQPSSYSTSSNSGQRDVVCTTLAGTKTSSYYTGSNSFESLSSLSETSLYNALNELMKSTHRKNSSYNDCRDMASDTDCENNNGRVTLIYTSYSAKQSDNGSSGASWNREHVWPKSLGGYNTSGAGADLHHIRPSDSRVNSTRGNMKYGNASGGKTAASSALCGGISGGTYSGGYFEPHDNVKGDVARICLYMYVRYGKDTSYTCNSITTVFQSIDVLLEWCELDPVDTWEMGRNEVVAAYQGNRNVFIDYPEFAWLIFGRSIPSGLVTPSGNASSLAPDPTPDPDPRPDPDPTPTPNPGTPSVQPGCRHSNTETRGAIPESCGSDGFSGESYCLDCGEQLSYGALVPASGEHTMEKHGSGGSAYEECSVCGYTVSTPEEGGFFAWLTSFFEMIAEFFAGLFD